LLGAIEGVVGYRDELRDVATEGGIGDAEAASEHRHVASVRSGQHFSKSIEKRFGSFAIDLLEREDELLPAVAGDQIRPTRRLPDDAREMTERAVRVVPGRVVEPQNEDRRWQPPSAPVESKLRARLEGSRLVSPSASRLKLRLQKRAHRTDAGTGPAVESLQSPRIDDQRRQCNTPARP
jgi:hypothetical protein